jgi:hypothetical protein
MQGTLAQNILKGMPLIIGIFLTIFLPILLHERTHHIAKKEGLTNKDGADDTLDWLLNWRDLLIAVPTGLFVLQFAAAGQLTSTCHQLFFIPLPETIQLSDISLLVVFFSPVLLLFGWLLAEKLELGQVKNPPIYWLIFLFSVLPWYILSFFFVYSPDCISH